MSIPPTFDFRGRRLCRENCHCISNGPATITPFDRRRAPSTRSLWKDSAKTTVKISLERERERERDETCGKTNRREMEINVQPARGNADEIRIFKQYRAITFDAQFN